MSRFVYDLLFIGLAAVAALLFCRYLVRDKASFMKFRNWLLIPLTALGGLVVYGIGYYDGGTAGSWATLGIRSFLSTFHMFFLHSDLLEVRHAMHGEPLYMFFFSIIHLSAFIISFMIVIQLFGKRLMARWRLGRHRGESVYLFFGVTDAAFSLAADLLANDRGRLVVLIGRGDLGKRTELYEQAERIGAVWVDRDYEAGNSLERLGLASCLNGKRLRLFFLTGNEDLNIRTALDVLGRMGPAGGRDRPVSVFVLTETEGMPPFYREAFAAIDGNVEIHPVNRAEITASELIAHHAPVDYLGVDRQRAAVMAGFEVVMVGFGQSGTSLLRAFVEHGQFPEVSFRALVVDRDMGGKRGRFESLYPGMRSYDIEYVEAEVDSAVFTDRLRGRLDSLCCAVVALGDDRLNMQTAFDLHAFVTRHSARSIDILVQVYDNDAYGYVRMPGHSLVSITPFGRHRSIFTEETVVHENRLLMARQIHDFYNRNKTDKLRWEELTEIKMKTNLSAAVHVHTKLALTGFSPDVVRAMGSTDAFVAALGAERLARLAQGEHLHWNAVLHANGWQVWPLEEIPPESRTNQDERRKCHACLVSWEGLTAVGLRFGVEYRTFDAGNVEKIYELAAHGLIAPRPGVRDRRDAGGGEPV